MGLSKKEVNLRRLLGTAPQQQNKGKLVHVCSTPLNLVVKMIWFFSFYRLTLKMFESRFQFFVATGKQEYSFVCDGNYAVCSHSKRATGATGWREDS